MGRGIPVRAVIGFALAIAAGTLAVGVLAADLELLSRVYESLLQRLLGR